MKDHVYDDVIAQLRQGKVLPIFHTLCHPPSERLFLPNTHVSVDDETSDGIQLSTEPVSMGEAVKDVESEISLEDEMSYIPAFFQRKRNGTFLCKRSSILVEFYSIIYTNCNGSCECSC
jgi:hypothetical protein